MTRAAPRAGLGLVAAVAFSAMAAAGPSAFHASAPPAGVTGGFGEATCASCHIGSDVNAFGGRVRVEGLPTAYEPGDEYVLTVDLRADETAVAGFQLSARFSDGRRRGASAGALEPLDSRTAVADSVGVRYLHQTETGSRTADASGGSWSFLWRAPMDGRSVVLHVAANSGNGDNSPLGDLVYTSVDTLPSSANRPHPSQRSP
ncbi:MAG: choice-of-anchor V domain-containing protein [Longimicrobiales bacterium]|nr:choice-of-anchor V domain-containing protein [Longimicrobiales bacterium]